MGIAIPSDQQRAIARRRHEAVRQDEADRRQAECELAAQIVALDGCTRSEALRRAAAILDKRPANPATF